MKAKLTDKDKAEILKRLAAGEKAADLAKEYSVSVPTIYNVRKKPPEPAVTAVAVLEQEIARDERRVSELKKIVVEIEELREQIKVKKAALESLKKLELVK